MLTDTHCHLYLNLYHEDLDAVLDRAWEKDLGRILLPGIDLPTSRQALVISRKDTRLSAAVGVHPNDSLSWTEDSLDELRTLARDPKVVAIGEIGLDYYREHAPHDLQQRIFQDQLDLAAELELPVVIHNRQSWDDLWPILRSWQEKLARQGSSLAERPGVLHSFEGNQQQAEDAIARGFSIGISGPVTFKNAPERQKLVAGLPVESLLTETDAPYLTPMPFRGRRNEPAYVIFICGKIAELHQLSISDLSKITAQNAARLFRWDNSD